MWEEAGGWFHAPGPVHQRCPASAGEPACLSSASLPGKPALQAPWSLNSACTSLPPPTESRGQDLGPPSVPGAQQGRRTGSLPGCADLPLAGSGARPAGSQPGASPGEEGLAEETNGADVEVTPRCPSRVFEARLRLCPPAVCPPTAHAMPSCVPLPTPTGLLDTQLEQHLLQEGFLTQPCPSPSHLRAGPHRLFC